MGWGFGSLKNNYEMGCISMMKKYSVRSLVLAFCLCFMVAMPAMAAEDTDEFMPSEIIGALNGINTVSGEYDTTNNDIIAKIAKPTSLDINNIVNIDVNKIHQTYPLTENQKQKLAERGYSEEEIEQMDMGDFFNLESTWIINPSIISSIKFLYPELADVDINNWTYGDWQAYYKADNEKKYAPSAEEEQALIERNITLEDAKTLLSDYYTYENILAQTDEQLANDISQYYQFNIENIYDMLQYEENVDENILRINPPTNPNSNYYIKVNFPGYKEDWFHKNSGSDNEDFRAEQAAATQAAYNCIYNTTSSFKATNMYGTWSISSQGAHEGLDFNQPSNKTTTCSIYSIAEGKVLKGKNSSSNTSGQLSIYVNTTSKGYSVNKTFTFLHMSSIIPNVNDTIKTGNGVGNQGNKGFTSNPNSGYHVHFQVEEGSTTTLSSAILEGYRNSLDSKSPYQLRAFLSY